MSKSALKKELLKLTKEQLVEQILDLYEKNKSIKEFYDFYLNPHNEKELMDKYKKIIRKEFNVERPERSDEKFSVAKKAISEFKSLQPSPEALADVMLFLPESACERRIVTAIIPNNFMIRHTTTKRRIGVYLKTRSNG
jgi:hypothetical protein